MTTQPTITLEADLNDDGTFEEDWSQYLLGFKTGLKRESALDGFRPRTARLSLDNADGRFTPRNTAGPYSPDLVGGKRVRLKAKVATPAIANLIKNPSVETDTTDYTGVNNASLLRTNASVARYGQYGLVVTKVTDTVQYRLEIVNGTAPTQSLDYTASIYVRGIGAMVGKRVRIELAEDGGASAQAGTTGSYTTLTEHLQRLSVTRNIVEADRTQLILIIRREDADIVTTEQWVVDGAQIEQASSANVYCDGDQPGGSWSGTAHASSSSRAADPEFTLFLGELRELAVERSNLIGVAEYECSGILESLLGVNISAGPFTRERADVIGERILDVVESEVAERITGLTGEAILDPARRIDADTWVVPTGSLDSQKDLGEAGDDPVDFDSLEGDNVLEITPDGGTNLFDFYTDVVSNVTADKQYVASCWVKGSNAADDGQTVALSIGADASAPGGGAVIAGTVDVSSTLWQLVKTFFKTDDPITGVRFNPTAADTFANPVYFDGLHLSPSFANLGIVDAPSFVGTKWAGEIEYLDAFHRRAGLVLAELARSVGGWLYEGGGGGIVFEDYSQRDSAVVTEAKMRLTDYPENGIPFSVQRYIQPATALYNRVKVGSYGNISAISAGDDAQARTAWALEPPALAFSADQQRTFFADYAREEEQGGVGGLIVRRPVAVVRPSSGWTTVDGIATPWVKSYGRSGEVVLKDDGSATTTKLLRVHGRLSNRQTTERAFVSNGVGDPVLELDASAQGYKTSAMDDLAAWAQARYSGGPATLDVDISGLDAERQLNVFGRVIGEPVWVQHNTGPSNFAIDAMFFCEGVEYSWRTGELPALRMMLEEA